MDRDDAQKVMRGITEHALTWEDDIVQAQCRRLRSDRNFEELARLTERASRFDPQNPELRRLQAQALIELGQLATALSVLEGVDARLDHDHPEWPELQGLTGRACKQIFLESGSDSGSDNVRSDMLKRAISAYRSAYEIDRGRYWHGVNLLALEALADREGILSKHEDAWNALAQQVMVSARSDAEGRHEPWAYATMAEASVALGNLDDTEAALREFLSAPGLTSFHVGSLLRQLVQVWRLGKMSESWQGILTVLRAVHAKMPGTDAVLLDASDINQQRVGDDRLEFQFERIIGAGNLVTFEWWQLAMQQAAAVAAVRDERNQRIGTAFAVDGGSLLAKWKSTTLVLTNFHVVNRQGVAKGLRPENATLVFEAVNPGKHYDIKQILWESPTHEFDCAILLLEDAPDSRVASIAERMPTVGQQPASRVFVIGHPSGRGLEFSINDNELLDHDEAQQQPVTRLHYRAATEEGSSGSPVFKEGRLEAIAIHHGFTRSKLNGKAGSYEANEGIGLKSLKAALARIEKDLPDIP